MPANLRYLIIKSLLLVGLVWQTHCLATATLPHAGKIICVSDPSGRTGAQVENTRYLTTNAVKDIVIETYSELKLRRYLEETPRFYKYKSTVFTDLDQRNAIKDDYILMKNQLQSIKDQFHSNSESMSEADFNKVSQTLEKLEAFQKLIQKGIQDRIHKMKDQGSHIKGIKMIGMEENDSLNKKAKIASPSSETVFQRDLGLDIVEQISDRVWDGQVDKLSGILHGIPLLRDKDQKIIQGDGLYLELQNLLFQQVGYMYKQKLISGEAFKNFCQSKLTLEIAAFNMIHTTECAKHPLFSMLSPITVLNSWTCEDYRNIYGVLDENNKRYFWYLSLRALDYTFTSIGNVQLESLFGKDKLFYTLESLVSPPSINSDSRMKLQEQRNLDPNYVQIKKSVQDLMSMFKDNQNDPVKNVKRERSFLFLDFIQTHYGLEEMFQLEKGEKFEEKMRLMLASFQLAAELNNIYWYVKDRRNPGKNIPETQINKNGEEILMMYKLQKYLISKHQHLFLDSEMSMYCRTYSLKLLERNFELAITQIIDQHIYFLHLDS